MVTHADAAIFGDDVSLADLAKLSPEAFNSLKDVEFAVFTEKVKHAGAVEAEKKFREVVKSAKSMLVAKKMHLKASETELKDVKEKSVGKKLKEAEEKVAAAQQAHETAQRYYRWQDRELDTLAVSAEKERRAVSAAEAERDLVRVFKLQEQGVSSAQKYNMEDFKKRLEKRRKEHAEAAEKEKASAADANRLRSDYDKVLKESKGS